MIETLGEAYRLGWRLTARCVWSAPGRKTKPGRAQIQCDTVDELDMKTVVWTRGERFPLSELASRLKCPVCGSRRVAVMFRTPSPPQTSRARL
jgi:hypothetical protein